MRCPNGTRRNKDGECQPKGPKPIPRRCPKGMKRYRDVCIPKGTKKRCPNGTRKNKQGVCEPKITATPRTQYACRFKKPIYLSERELFQIHFDTPDQFTNYVNLSKAPKLDCGYQSLFALGLLEVEHAKKSAEEVNTKGKVGIYNNELMTFFRVNFGFTPKETIEVYNRHYIKLFLKHHLANNHATILLLQLKSGHYIVAYKYKDVVHFYDPQASKHRDVDEKTLFYYFKVTLDGPKLFQPIQKSLPFVG